MHFTKIDQYAGVGEPNSIYGSGRERGSFFIPFFGFVSVVVLAGVFLATGTSEAEAPESLPTDMGELLKVLGGRGSVE